MNNTRIENIDSNEYTRNRVKQTIVILSFAALMIVAAHVRIPALPVPFTLQTFVVILSAFVMRSRLASISQVIYLTYGLGGAAIFANGGGLGYVLSPTFGYIIGFIVMAYMLGRSLEKVEKENLTFKKFMSIGLLGVVVQLSLGTIYLYVLLNAITGTGITVWAALMNGFLIFIPHEIVKVAVAGVIAKKANV
ncbi:MAG: biotin transporter BioY [Oscillospiraceae bacterium]|nr:biotin transporter BioY [Oscillospiraceae bacterium]